MPQRLFIVEHRNEDEGSLVAFAHPESAECVAFMRRNADSDSRERPWWWAMYLHEVGADWGDLSTTVAEDLWIYSWDAELMNYQPIGGYTDGDPDDPPPRPPPASANGLP